MSNDEITPASITRAAMFFLSMREHSAKELHAKLAQKFNPSDWIDAVIEKLKNDGLQSDERFSEALIAMRLRQGKGAIIIAVELKEKGISATLINQYLDHSEQAIDWNELALKAYRKKFGEGAIHNLKDKAKRIRFLTTRGFSSANIHYALTQPTTETD